MIARPLASAALCALLLFGSASALASEEAREAFRSGREAFRAGKYDKALTALKRAYNLKPHPALLRYMAQTYQKLDKPKEALEHFKRYLKDAPQASDKVEIEAKIRELDLALKAAADKEADEGSSEDDPKPPVAGSKGVDADAPTGDDWEVPDALKKKQLVAVDTGPAKPRTSPLTVMKWVTAGVGVAGLVVGFTFSALAASKARDLEDAVLQTNPDMAHPTVPYQKTHHDLQEAARTNRMAAAIGLVAGGLALGTSVALFIVDGVRGRKTERRAFVAPLFGSTNGVGGQLTF